jgi:uncharacterized membrane protein YdjX (TVP38/TMEM64 family)
MKSSNKNNLLNLRKRMKFQNLSIMLLFLIILLFIEKKYGIKYLYENLTMKDLMIYIESYSITERYLIIFLLSFITTVLFFPTSPINIIAGILLGSLNGTITFLLGSLLGNHSSNKGASLSFYLGRYFLR